MLKSYLFYKKCIKASFLQYNKHQMGRDVIFPQSPELFFNQYLFQQLSLGLVVGCVPSSCSGFVCCLVWFFFSSISKTHTFNHSYIKLSEKELANLLQFIFFEIGSSREIATYSRKVL